MHAEFSWLLAGLHKIARFGVLFPLGLAGMVFAWREREPGSASELVMVLVGLFAFAVSVFYVWARYRFPLVPMLMPFAGLALVRGYEKASRGLWRQLALPGAALVLAGIVSNLALLDRAALTQTAWMNLANIMLREQQFEEADTYLQHATALDRESADLHFHLASLRFRQGRPEAEQHLRRMLSLDPTDFRGHRLLARILKAAGRHDEAKQHLREAVRLNPDRKRRGRPGAPIPRAERDTAR